MNKATKPETYTEVWYYVEGTRRGEDDWNRVSSEDFDTPESAKKWAKKYATPALWRNWEFRVVKRTTTDEVIA